MSTAERWVIVDGHEDLAMGALADGRDYLGSAFSVRAAEAEAGFVGVLPLNWALDSSWRASDGKDAVTLDAVVAAIDVVCQVAGDAAHVGLGTDFDGGQGAEAAPAELDTIADLPKLASALAARGFADADIAAVMGGNWLEFLRRQLP